MKTQGELILDHLKSGKSLTPIDALNMFGCFRLGARIYDLKQDGHNITTENVTKDGKTFASYSLKEELREPLWQPEGDKCRANIFKNFKVYLIDSDEVDKQLDGQQSLDL